MDLFSLPLSQEVLHYATFAPVDNEAHSVLECPLYKPSRAKYPSRYENVVLGSLKSFFQLDHQVDLASIARRLPHARESARLNPS